jgi:flavodoxin
LKIGIIVYSQTGNTYLVASKIYESLKKKGYKVDIEKIEALRNQKNNTFEFKKVPDVKSYDVIIFGSPVEAFSLCPVMKKYLENIKSLKNKKVLCFVTEAFPYPWMGGNRAIKQMKALCNQKGATIYDTGVANWKNKKREELINNIVVTFTNTINGLK